MGMLGRLMGMMFMMRLETEVPEGMISKSKKTGNMFMDEDGRCWCIARCFLEAYIYTHPYKIYLSIYLSQLRIVSNTKQKTGNSPTNFLSSNFITLCLTSTYSYRPPLPIFPSSHLMQPIISLAQFLKKTPRNVQRAVRLLPRVSNFPPSSNPSRI